ncbi:MAG: hypothetical protein HeimC3_18830 [Candidatus Heimdallarchaeota archaeon LC_3]|nr:MAG: hypothetical protein HeimC3_18830 [Candidatus Heimdallarchaeota archaeon LC_3]
MKKESKKTLKEIRKKPKRRNMLERVEEIFNFIEKQYEVFPKSRLKEIGINPSSAENWLKLIEYIQNQPRIRLISSKNNLLIEKIEGKYQAMIRKVITDETMPYEQRSILMSNYLPSLYTREKLELDRHRNEKKNSKFSLSKLELVKFVEENFLEVKNKNDLKELKEVYHKWLKDNKNLEI